MSRKVNDVEVETVEVEEVSGLRSGFYLIDVTGALECVTRNVRPKGKPAYQVREPLRYRTIKAAQDVCSALASRGGSFAILCVTEDGFPWGEG